MASFLRNYPDSEFAQDAVHRANHAFRYLRFARTYGEDRDSSAIDDAEAIRELVAEYDEIARTLDPGPRASANRLLARAWARFFEFERAQALCPGCAFLGARLENPAGTPVEWQTGFAFTDSTRTRMLSVNPLRQPARLRHAVCSGAPTAAVRFRGRQAAGPDDTGRATTRNFARFPGDVFETADGRPVVRENCLILGDSIVGRHRPVPVHALDGETCDPTVTSEIRDARARPVTDCWQLAEVEGTGVVMLTVFARNGDDMLASIVLSAADSLSWKDYPARYDEDSVWRVGDGGEVGPGNFDVLFALTNESELLIGLGWAGAEGLALTLLERDGPFLRLALSGNRYWAPL